MTRRQAKGQILIIIVLVLIGIIVIFALASRSSVRVRATPLVREAYWTIGNSPVTTGRVGDHVEAHVVIEAVEEYVGSVTFKVRKDISIWPDSDYHISTVPVSLRGGDEHEIEIAFVPDQGSGGGFRSLRGYFIEVEFQATETTWVMESSYPPRLSVLSLD